MEVEEFHRASYKTLCQSIRTQRRQLEDLRRGQHRGYKSWQVQSVEQH